MFKCLIFNVASKGLARSLGAHRIAHYLREQDWDAEVFDHVLYFTLDELKYITRSRVDSDTKFIGFSHLFSTWSPTLEEYCQWLKKTYPTINIISGGSVTPHFDSKYIDYYIHGYGENALTALLKWLYSNGDRPRFTLLGTNNKRIIAGNDQYPSFPMKKLMIKYQDRDYLSPDEWLITEFSRGCKFKCDFCNFPVLGVKGDYSRDADDFYEQTMDAYDRFGITNYLVSDETFNDRTEKITKFADAVNRMPFTPWFSGFIRADLLISRPRDREELLRMNFLGHHYGIESFNYNAAKAVGKGMHPSKVKAGLIDIENYFKNNGRKLYRGTTSFVLGLPGETLQDLDDTFQWLVDNWQGNSFSPFALQIPKGSLEVHSKISIDYKKYGYSEMTGVNLSKPTYDKFPDISNDLVIWENPQMNYYQAHAKMIEMINQKNNYNFKLSIWELSMLGLGSTIEERLMHTGNVIDHGTSTPTKETKALFELIINYKMKKLNS